MSLNPATLLFPNTGTSWSVHAKLSGRTNSATRSCTSGWSHHERRSSSWSVMKPASPATEGVVKGAVYWDEMRGEWVRGGVGGRVRASEVGGQAARTMDQAERAGAGIDLFW